MKQNQFSVYGATGHLGSGEPKKIQPLTQAEQKPTNQGTMTESELLAMQKMAEKNGILLTTSFNRKIR